MKKQLLTAAVFALIGFLAAAQPWMMRPQGPVNEFSALEGTSVLNYNMVPERNVHSRAGYRPAFYIFPDGRLDNKQALELAPYVDRCIFSFVEMYKKLEVNMPELRQVSEQDKLTLAKGMGAIARKNGLYLQTCATKEDYEPFGIHRSGCMTAEIFSRALGVQFKKVSHKGNRAGCLCMESRGLGDYNSCPNGCRYCYANKDHAKALQNYLTHDPESPLLLGYLQPGDKIVPSRQESVLSKERGLFD